MYVITYPLCILAIEFFIVILGEPPKLQPFTFPETVTFGDRVNVICGIKSGMKPLNYKWLKNGKMLLSTDNLTIDMQTDYSVLTIVPSSRNDAGNYTCLVENKFGKDSFTAQLFLKAPPVWIKYPKDLKIVQGSCIEVECRAEGLPQPEIIWKLRTGMKIHERILN
ncbi:Down syndrome cell adhesion molecule-like protein Dscam2 [Centruroides sculpturatus]|uniref:Down syndrome cell adhesion molecule-like protein Dscam2 n=1 Tax=Centruroides sculpturatus TaxID=218467 RepID=UPI000C6CBB87|nr:Down syndrome cell adhesion molecule-like protein Dscam2 [Centruroides sculpturatus]